MNSPRGAQNPNCSETSAEKQERDDEITMNVDGGAGETSADDLMMESDGEFLDGFNKVLKSLTVSLDSDSHLTLSPEGDIPVKMTLAEKRRIKKKRRQERKALESKSSLPSSAESDQNQSPALPGESDSTKDQHDSESQKANKPKKNKTSDSKKVTSESDSKKDESFSEANQSDKKSFSDSKKARKFDSKKDEKTLTTKPVKIQNSDSANASRKQQQKKDGGSKQAPTKSDKTRNSDTANASRKQKQKKDGESNQTENSTPNNASGKKGSGENSKAKLVPNVGNKRKHNSPTTNHQPAKKQAKPWSFRDAVKADVTVLVRTVGSGFSTNQLKELRAKLCERLDATPLGAVRPIFESNKLINGAFQVECVNLISKGWLIQQITEIDSLDGVKLWVTTAEREASRQRITMTIQDSQSVSSDIIFRRFREANLGLKTDEWVLIKTLADGPKGRTIMLSVDRDSADFMIARDKKLYYMLQRVYIDIRYRVLEGQSAENPNPPVSES